MPNAFNLIDTTWIDLPDGRRLAARMWLPRLEQPVPAILEYLPYRQGDGTAPRDETTHTVLPARAMPVSASILPGPGTAKAFLMTNILNKS